MRDHVLTVGDVVAMYLEDVALRVRAGKLDARTRDKVASYCEDFARFMRDAQVPACKKQDLTRWLLNHPEWVSQHTQADAVRSVSTCFRWALDEDHVPKNPYRAAKLAFDLQPRRAMTTAQYVAIMRAANRSLETPEALGERLQKEAADRLCRDTPEARDAIDRVCQRPHGVHAGDVDNINVRPTGTSADAALRRLRKDRPDPRPLAVHLEDYRTHLRGQRFHASYKSNLLNRARRIIDGCGFQFIKDLSTPAVAAYVACKLVTNRP